MQGVGVDVERQDMQYYTESVVCTQVVSLSSMLMPSYVPLPAISMQAHISALHEQKGIWAIYLNKQDRLEFIA